MNNKSFYAMVVILVTAGVIAISAYFADWNAKGNEQLVSSFPLTVGDWSGSSQAIDERTYQVLETRNLFIRDYRNGKGDSINLYVVYSQDNRRAMHPPEICLTGGGLEILNKSSIQITKSIRAIKLLTEKADTREIVLYWYKAGDLSTDAYIQQQLKIVINRLMGKPTSGAMIRVSTLIKNRDETAAQEQLKIFCIQIEPLIEKFVP